MFGLGGGEIAIVLILALIFLGPERLPGLAEKLGKLVREAKKAVQELKKEVDR